MSKRKLASRRQFLQTSILAAAGLAIGGACNNQQKESSANADEKKTSEPEKKTVRNVGLQLYSIQHLLQDDFKGTLKAIADIGYKEIEFAGPYNFSSDKTIAGWKSY